MDPRPVAAVCALLLVAAGAVGCGDDRVSSSAASKQEGAALAQQERTRRAGVEQAIAAGKLPPVAIEMFPSTGSVNPNIINGPEPNGGDIVRTRDHGRSGPPLAWDLDGDGEISAAERHITEMDLYDATLRYAAGAQ